MNVDIGYWGKKKEEFCRIYDITEEGNFEGKNSPNRIYSSEDDCERNDPRLKKLYDYRLGRTHLHKDDKILLSWNGMRENNRSPSIFIFKGSI